MYKYNTVLVIFVSKVLKYPHCANLRQACFAWFLAIEKSVQNMKWFYTKSFDCNIFSKVVLTLWTCWCVLWSPRGSRCKLRVGKIFGLDTWIRRYERSYGLVDVVRLTQRTIAEIRLSKHMIYPFALTILRV